MKTVTATHELDKLFDITPGQTEISVPDGRPSSELVEMDDAPLALEGELMDPTQTAIESYDRKDDAIEGELDDVRLKAIEAYETMIVAAQTVLDKKHAPRNAEVAATFLQIALNAVKEKNSTKDRKDKIVVASKRGAVTGPQKVINNNIVTDRATLLKMLRKDDA